MFERSCFRTLFRSYSVSGSQTLLKPERQHFYPNFPLLSDKLSWKRSGLARCEILGQFFDTLTGCHLFFLQNLGKSVQQVQT